MTITLVANRAIPLRMLQNQIFDLKLGTIKAETVTFFVLILVHNNQDLSGLSVLYDELESAVFVNQ